MHAIATGLAAAAEKAGVDIRYGVAVERIVLEPAAIRRVRGVRPPTASVAADAVVCNADLPGAYGLVPGLDARRGGCARPHCSPSAVVWHAGVRGLPPAGIAHHNIHFGAAWDGSFRR